MQTLGAWTLEDAQAALPEVRGLLAAARGRLASLRETEAQLADLRTIWGDQVLSVSCPEHHEWLRHCGEHADRRKALVEALREFEKRGIEAKDIEQGLVDFRGRVGDREAYLCWRDGEDAIAWWHPMEGGFSARRRIPH